MRGFESDKAREFLATFFADVPLLPAGSTNGSALVVHRDEHTLAQDTDPGDPATVLVMERLLDLYRVDKSRSI